MQQPQTHLDVMRERHCDLLREARAGELAARIGAARREERRTLLARLRTLPGVNPRSVGPARS